MLELFDEFRNALDNAMLCAMHSRIVLYGYGYTGKFLKWYADYYHSIKVDYIVSLDMVRITSWKFLEKVCLILIIKTLKTRLSGSRSRWMRA